MCFNLLWIKVSFKSCNILLFILLWIMKNCIFGHFINKKRKKENERKKERKKERTEIFLVGWWVGIKACSRGKNTDVITWPIVLRTFQWWSPDHIIKTLFWWYNSTSPILGLPLLLKAIYIYFYSLHFKLHFTFSLIVFIKSVN